VITLLIDGVTAVVKTIDRALTAAEGVRRPGGPLPVDDVQPAGVAPETGPGGHHNVRDTSELLFAAAGYVSAYRVAIRENGPGPFLELLEDFAAELRDRAASLAAVGD